jgi:hypothetical protein
VSRLPAAPAYGLIRRGCSPANLVNARHAMAARWAWPAAEGGMALLSISLVTSGKVRPQVIPGYPLRQLPGRAGRAAQKLAAGKEALKGRRLRKKSVAAPRPAFATTTSYVEGATALKQEEALHNSSSSLSITRSRCPSITHGLCRCSSSRFASCTSRCRSRSGSGGSSSARFRFRAFLLLLLLRKNAGGRGDQFLFVCWSGACLGKTCWRYTTKRHSLFLSFFLSFCAPLPSSATQPAPAQQKENEKEKQKKKHQKHTKEELWAFVGTLQCMCGATEPVLANMLGN